MARKILRQEFAPTSEQIFRTTNNATFGQVPLFVLCYFYMFSGFWLLLAILRHFLRQSFMTCAKTKVAPCEIERWKWGSVCAGRKDLADLAQSRKYGACPAPHIPCLCPSQRRRWCGISSWAGPAPLPPPYHPWSYIIVQYIIELYVQWGGHHFQPLESLYNINVLLRGNTDTFYTFFC